MSKLFVFCDVHVTTMYIFSIKNAGKHTLKSRATVLFFLRAPFFMQISSFIKTLDIFILGIFFRKCLNGTEEWKSSLLTANESVCQMEDPLPSFHMINWLLPSSWIGKYFYNSKGTFVFVVPRTISSCCRVKNRFPTGNCRNLTTKYWGSYFWIWP